NDYEIVVVLVTALTLGSEHSDTADTNVIDPDQLSRGIVAIGEKLLVNVVAEYNDLGFFLFLFCREEATDERPVVADLKPACPDTESVRIRILVARLDLSRRLNLGGYIQNGRGRFLIERFEILHLQTIPGARTPLDRAD